MRRRFAGILSCAGAWAAACAAACAAVLVTGTAAAAGRDDPVAGVAIEEVAPFRTDTALVCMVRTRGLPDPPSRETLESGLPSSLVLALTLLAPSGDEIGGTRVEVRIEPDLWEGHMLVRGPGGEARVPTMNDLAERLRWLGPFPALPAFQARARSAQAPLRIRARMAVHPLARGEARLVQEIFAGGASQDAETDRREVSIGLTALLRYFLGREREEEWTAEGVSLPFSWGALGPVPDGPGPDTAPTVGAPR